MILIKNTLNRAGLYPPGIEAPLELFWWHCQDDVLIILWFGSSYLSHIKELTHIKIL